MITAWVSLLGSPSSYPLAISGKSDKDTYSWMAWRLWDGEVRLFDLKFKYVPPFCV